jgi:hypothetical protein
VRTGESLRRPPDDAGEDAARPVHAHRLRLAATVRATTPACTSAARLPEDRLELLARCGALARVLLEELKVGADEGVAAAYQVLTSHSFRDYAGNPADPESGALQALLDGIATVEGSGPRHVVHCQACSTEPHNGLKHGEGSSLGALGATCQVPGCGCPGYRPRCLEDM